MFHTIEEVITGIRVLSVYIILAKYFNFEATDLLFNKNSTFSK